MSSCSDDDAIVEPESVFRTATFFSLAKEEFAVGGAMLDLLRPTEMYEAGGFVLPWRLGVGGRGRDLSLESADNVLSLADPRYPHYNAWWFFACPLSLVSRLGLPLPLFIRCDDLEFGCRLMRAGIRTISLPGRGRLAPAVLPEETRLVGLLLPPQRARGHRDSLLQVAALAGRRVPRHADLSPADVGLFQGLGRVPRDGRLSPGTFPAQARSARHPSARPGSPPQPVARAAAENRIASGDCRPAGTQVARASTVQSDLGALLRQLVRSSPGNEVLPDHALSGKDEHWHALRKANVVAIDDPGNDGYVLLRRDRRSSLVFLARGLRTASRLMLVHGRTAKKWRAETRQLTEPRFWHEYLGLTAAESPQASIDLPKGL